MPWSLLHSVWILLGFWLLVHNLPGTWCSGQTQDGACDCMTRECGASPLCPSTLATPTLTNGWGSRQTHLASTCLRSRGLHPLQSRLRVPLAITSLHPLQSVLVWPCLPLPSAWDALTVGSRPLPVREMAAPPAVPSPRLPPYSAGEYRPDGLWQASAFSHSPRVCLTTTCYASAPFHLVGRGFLAVTSACSTRSMASSAS